MTEAQISGFQLVDIYNSIYFRSFLKAASNDGSSSDNVYNEWLKLADMELAIELRSAGFTSALSRYIDSLVELYSMYRSAGFPVDYFDWLFDLYFHNLSFFSSMAKEQKLSSHDVIFEKGKARLLHYRISDKKEYNTGPALLVIYAPINRFHILDLNQHRSVVRNLLSHGLDVYLLDWGYVDKEDDSLSLSDYVGYVEDAVQAIKNDQKKRSENVSILGYCWGGIIALIYSSLHNDVKSLTLMATPVDFGKDDTVLATWSRAIDIDKMMDEFGRMDGQALDLAFLMRNPLRYAFDKYLRFFKKLHDREVVRTFLDVERWLHDTPPIPGNLHRKIINDCYKNNLLASNKMEIVSYEKDGGIGRTQKIDLKKITAPILSIIAGSDDLVASKSALAVNDLVSSKDKATLTNPGGHVALCVSDTAHKRLWPEVAEWILSR
jgi:polyhydroxyalkanoate synthase